jgi:hypothetical protein
MGITSLNEFVSLYVSKVIASQGKLSQRLFKNVKTWLPSVKRLSFDIGTDPIRIHLEIDPENKQGIAEALSLTEKLKKKVTVALDEFQDVTSIRSPDIIVELRKNFQFFKNTSFIFSGSRRHMMKDSFSNPEKPFYRFSSVMSLGRIQEHEATGFIMKKFEETGIKAKPEKAKKIATMVEGHPYYIQAVSFYAWNAAKRAGKLSDKHIASAIEKVINLESGAFHTLWDNLTTNQRQVLKKLAHGNSPYELPISAGSVKRALETLQTMDIVEKNGSYKIIDPILRLWVLKLISKFE